MEFTQWNVCIAQRREGKRLVPPALKSALRKLFFNLGCKTAEWDEAEVIAAQFCNVVTPAAVRQLYRNWAYEHVCGRLTQVSGERKIAVSS